MPKLTPFYSLLLLPVFFAGCKKGVSTTKAIDISQYTSKMIGTRLWSGEINYMGPTDTTEGTLSIIDTSLMLTLGTDDSVMILNNLIQYSAIDTILHVLHFAKIDNNPGFQKLVFLNYYYLQDSMSYYYNFSHNSYYTTWQFHTN